MSGSCPPIAASVVRVSGASRADFNRPKTRNLCMLASQRMSRIFIERPGDAVLVAAEIEVGENHERFHPQRLHQQARVNACQE